MMFLPVTMIYTLTRLSLFNCSWSVFYFKGKMVCQHASGIIKGSSNQTTNNVNQQNHAKNKTEFCNQIVSNQTGKHTQYETQTYQIFQETSQRGYSNRKIQHKKTATTNLGHWFLNNIETFLHVQGRKNILDHKSHILWQVFFWI